jgi:hypothetical protein
MYLSPFAIAKCFLEGVTEEQKIESQGEVEVSEQRGVVLVQTGNHPIEMMFERPLAVGRGWGGGGSSIDDGVTPLITERQISLMYLNLSEYEQGLAPSNPELFNAELNDTLKSAIEEYEPKTHVLCLIKAKGGFCALIKMKLVPDFKICGALAGDYVGKEELLLNIDDDL